MTQVEFGIVKPGALAAKDYGGLGPRVHCRQQARGRCTWGQGVQRNPPVARGAAQDQLAFGEGFSQGWGLHRCGQHVVSPGGHGLGITVREALGRDQYQPVQSHCFHRPCRRADVARVLGPHQDDAKVVKCAQMRMRHGGNDKLNGCLPSFLSPCAGASAMLQPAVNIMVKAARAGGNVLVRHMHRLDALNIIEKARMDYASEVDEKAEQAIIKELRRAYPDYAILGEEGGAQPGARGMSRYTWVIDPLDGTSNYLHNFPHWCVSIALCEGAEPLHAVIFDPLRNELFTATRGSGAQLNERRIRVSERRDLGGSLIATGFAPRERARADAQLECIKTLLVEAEDVRRAGSAALDLAYVACGRCDAYFEAGVQTWDIAAGVLLVREAGGKVCDFNGAALGPLNLPGKPGGHQVIAGGLRVADPLQAVIARSGYARAFAG